MDVGCLHSLMTDSCGPPFIRAFSRILGQRKRTVDSFQPECSQNLRMVCTGSHDASSSRERWVGPVKRLGHCIHGEDIGLQRVRRRRAMTRGIPGPCPRIVAISSSRPPESLPSRYRFIMNRTMRGETIRSIGTHCGAKRAIQKPKNWRKHAALQENGSKRFEVKHCEIGATEGDLMGNGVY